MAKAVAIWTGGIHDQRQYALRADGRMFKRFQVRDPRFGYRWSVWQATGEVLGENARSNPPRSIESGFSTLWRCEPNDACINHRAWISADGTVRARLPN